MGRAYDAVFFIFSPLLALALGFAVSRWPWARRDVTVWGVTDRPVGIFIGAFVLAHLFFVVFRSHFNPAVFRRHPWRFTAVPAALFVAMCASAWIATAVIVLTTWWDVYHSSLQTFGLARIYDAKAGNDPSEGRGLDFALNLLLYAGPIFAGATLAAHLKHFEEFRRVGAPFFIAIPERVAPWRPVFAAVLAAGGTAFVLYYLYRQWRMARAGRAVSRQKAALLASTALCSVFAWGFNPFGQAFFIMNFFHALQYFALVGWSERGHVARALRLGTARGGTWVALAVMLGTALAYGLWAQAVDERDAFATYAINVVAVMHFWYDGFVWSVREKMV